MISISAIKGKTELVSKKESHKETNLNKLIPTDMIIVTSFEDFSHETLEWERPPRPYWAKPFKAISKMDRHVMIGRQFAMLKK